MGQGERQNTLFLTLLAGAAGVGMGLLLAPRSGKETRQRLREAAIEAKDTTGDSLESAKENLDEQMDKVRAAKNNLLGKIRKTRRTDTSDNETLESPIIRAWEEI